MIGAAIRRDPGITYPEYPYSPNEKYPELCSMPRGKSDIDSSNMVYGLFRDLLVDLECDIENYGTSSWNPLGNLVSPGDTVIIKPNLVRDMEGRQDCVTTHPSVIRPIIDYVLLALDGKGSIIVGDAPTAEARFEIFQHEMGYQKLVDLYADAPVPVALRDFRALKTIGDDGIWTGVQENSSSEMPEHTIVDLGENSIFCIEDCENGRFHGGGYEIDDTISHHHGKVHEYCVSKDILEADVVISVPKLKTHKKAGITCCLKNLVGINCDKNYLPHFMMGPVNHGGDEMPELKSWNAMVMRAYNHIRQAIIGKHWMSLGKPAAAFLNLVSRSNKQEQDAASKAADSAETNQLSDQKDLGQWLHSKLSGQPIAAGSWMGNQTICRMILDLNQIALRSNQEGAIDEGPQHRKLFYVVDGIVAGAGNGPTSAIPVHAGILAAGYNGLQVDASVLYALGINPWSVPLYDKARKYSWMHPESDFADVLVDGHSLQAGEYSDIEFKEPDGWSYEKLPQGAEVAPLERK